MILEEAIKEVIEEYNWAVSKHGHMNSHHEGYAIILEEMDELWDEIKKKKEKRDLRLLKKEARQVAAMAVRFMIDVTNGDKPVDDKGRDVPWAHGLP